MKKVYMIWGLKKEPNPVPIVVGTYAKEIDAWKAYNEIPCTGWKWLDIKTLEVK